MNYCLETTSRFDREFKKLDRYTQKMLKSWIVSNLVGCDDPRKAGTVLAENLKGLWKYRIGDYRLICEIREKEFIILALSVGHRKGVYSF